MRARSVVSEEEAEQERSGPGLFVTRFQAGVVLGVDEALSGSLRPSFGRDILCLQRRMRDTEGLAQVTIERHGGLFRVCGGGTGPERTLEMIDTALPLGFAVVDEIEGEVTVPVALGDLAAIERAIHLVRGSEDGFAIVEGGPDLAYYVQAIRFEGELLLEAAGPASIPARHRLRVDRLRWLGFALPEASRPNARRVIASVETDTAVASTCLRALTEVYGLPVGAPLRVKLAGV